MKKKHYITYFFAFAILITPGLSWAHTGNIDSNALLSGFTHPLTGLDHLLTLFAIGILSSRQKSKDTYLYISLFLVGLSLGFALSTTQSSFSLAETIINLSILSFGAIIFFPINLPKPAMLSLIVMFSSAHGYAHGIETLGNSFQVSAGLLASSSLVILVTLFILRQNALRGKEFKRAQNSY